MSSRPVFLGLRARRAGVFIAAVACGACGPATPHVAASAGTAPRSEDWRRQPPAPGARPELAASPVQRSVLPNGLELYVIPRPWRSTVTARVVVRGGEDTNRPGKAGLAWFVAKLLSEGAGARSAEQVAGALDDLGTSLAVHVGANYAALTVEVLDEDSPSALGLLADLVMRPRLDEAAVARVADSARGELAEQRASDWGEAWAVLRARAFGRCNPYSLPGQGTAATIGGLTAADVRSYYEAHYRPDRAAVLVIGKVDAAAARAQVERLFGGWRARGDAAEPASFGPCESRATWPTIALVDRPSATSVQLAVGLPIPPRDDPSWETVDVLARALGAAPSSRINRALRRQRGTTYGAMTTTAPFAGTGLLYTLASSPPDRAAEALSIVRAEYERMATEPPTGAELARAKASLVLGTQRRLAVDTDTAVAASELYVYGWPLDALERTAARVDAITAEQVASAARAHLRADAMTVVVFGPADKLREPLGKLGTVEVIAAP